MDKYDAIAAHEVAEHDRKTRELTFHQFREANLKRCEQSYHLTGVKEWNAPEWACALAGEVGELCNLIKKQRRGEQISQEAIMYEMGDIVAYLDLLAAHQGIDLADAVRRKFNHVSLRIQSPVKL